VLNAKLNSQEEKEGIARETVATSPLNLGFVATSTQNQVGFGSNSRFTGCYHFLENRKEKEKKELF
jgi:hypothetical protein